MSIDHDPPRPLATGALLFGGDWACAHNDVGAIAHIAELLAARVGSPLRDRLLELARTCQTDPALAGQRWFETRAQVRDALRAAR